ARRAVQRGDDRLRTVLDATEDGRQRRALSQVALLEVRSGAEDGTGAGEDDGTDGHVPHRFVERLGKLGPEPYGEGVAVFGRVERDRRDAPVNSEVYSHALHATAVLAPDLEQRLGDLAERAAAH